MTDYPKELYAHPITGEPIRFGDTLNGSQVAHVIHRAYDRGQANAAKDTTDWHDLTAAIAAGEPIDFEALDGRRAKCEHKTMGALVHKFERDDAYPVESGTGHYVLSAPKGWGDIFVRAWRGERDWTLYIDGPVPMKRKTADQLKPGTFFTALHCGNEARFVVFETLVGKNLLARPLHGGNVYSYPAESVQVIEEYGVGTCKTDDE